MISKIVHNSDSTIEWPWIKYQCSVMTWKFEHLSIWIKTRVIDCYLNELYEDTFLKIVEDEFWQEYNFLSYDLKS